MEQDSLFRKDDCFGNILDKLELAGGLYEMPLSFLHALIGDSDVIQQTGMKVELVKTLIDDGVIGPGVLGAKGSFSYLNQVQLNSPRDYVLSLKEFTKNSKAYVTPHTEESGMGGYFEPYTAIGISAHSSVKQEILSDI